MVLLRRLREYRFPLVLIGLLPLFVSAFVHELRAMPSFNEERPGSYTQEAITLQVGSSEEAIKELYAPDDHRGVQLNVIQEFRVNGCSLYLGETRVEQTDAGFLAFTHLRVEISAAQLANPLDVSLSTEPWHELRRHFTWPNSFITLGDLSKKRLIYSFWVGTREVFAFRAEPPPFPCDQTMDDTFYVVSN